MVWRFVARFARTQGCKLEPGSGEVTLIARCLASSELDKASSVTVRCYNTSGTYKQHCGSLGKTGLQRRLQGVVVKNHKINTFHSIPTQKYHSWCVNYGQNLAYSCQARTRTRSRYESKQRHNYRWETVRYLTSDSHSLPKVMSAWQIERYGGVEELSLDKSKKIPVLQKPGDVFVEVHAASVNPIDTLLLGGYGSASWNKLRQARGMLTAGCEFPLILGRDLSGVVRAVGQGNSANMFKPGDEVWGALDPAFRQGTLAEYAVVPASTLTKKPTCLSHVEAASIPYVALTTWSALCTYARLSQKNIEGKRILIFGGSGGIGTFAIQLMKAWGAADITTTCSSDASDLVVSLGANTVIDYRTMDVKQELLQLPRYDVILNAVGYEVYNNSMDLLKQDGSATFVTISTPMLRNFDQYGMVIGGLKNVMSIGCDILKGLQKGRHYRWAFFLPNQRALEAVTSLVERQMIIPQVEKVYAFDQTPAAFSKVMTKHNRGKTVIDIKAKHLKEET